MGWLGLLVLGVVVMWVLEVSGLRKVYRSRGGEGVVVVDVPEFRLGEGEQVGLSGGSGTGKTTFLNLVAGIVVADGGSVRVGGREVVGLGEGARDGLRGGLVGYVFQSFNLLQGFTCLENVVLGMWVGGGVDWGRARFLLERVGLGGRLGYYPRELSVGEQQRAAVARALAGGPRLVLADEPTGSLDVVRGGEVLGLIREVCEEVGAALLLVSHDLGVLGSFGVWRDWGEVNRAVCGGGVV